MSLRKKSPLNPKRSPKSKSFALFSRLFQRDSIHNASSSRNDNLANSVNLGINKSTQENNVSFTKELELDLIYMSRIIEQKVEIINRANIYMQLTQCSNILQKRLSQAYEFVESVETDCTLQAGIVCQIQEFEKYFDEFKNWLGTVNATTLDETSRYFGQHIFIRMEFEARDLIAKINYKERSTVSNFERGGFDNNSFHAFGNRRIIIPKRGKFHIRAMLKFALVRTDQVIKITPDKVPNVLKLSDEILRGFVLINYKYDETYETLHPYKIGDLTTGISNIIRVAVTAINGKVEVCESDTTSTLEEGSSMYVMESMNTIVKPMKMPTLVSIELETDLSPLPPQLSSDPIMNRIRMGKSLLLKSGYSAEKDGVIMAASYGTDICNNKIPLRIGLLRNGQYWEYMISPRQRIACFNEHQHGINLNDIEGGIDVAVAREKIIKIIQNGFIIGFQSHKLLDFLRIPPSTISGIRCLHEHLRSPEETPALTMRRCAFSAMGIKIIQRTTRLEVEIFKRLFDKYSERWVDEDITSKASINPVTYNPSEAIKRELSPGPSTSKKARFQT